MQQLQAAGQGANIISGTYINSSIIVHNPGAQTAILVPNSVGPKKNILKKATVKSNS